MGFSLPPDPQTLCMPTSHPRNHHHSPGYWGPTAQPHHGWECVTLGCTLPVPHATEGHLLALLCGSLLVRSFQKWQERGLITARSGAPMALTRPGYTLAVARFN